MPARSAARRASLLFTGVCFPAGCFGNEAIAYLLGALTISLLRQIQGLNPLIHVVAGFVRARDDGEMDVTGAAVGDRRFLAIRLIEVAERHYDDSTGLLSS